MNATKLADVRGIELAYTDAGAGQTVLFLHGYPFDRTMWNGQVEFLRDAGFRAIAPDFPGFGETEAQAPITMMEEMALDAAALMDQLEIDEAVVCGLSMGGYVAFEFAHLFPARVRALVLAGTRAPGDNEKEKQVRAEQVQTILSEGMKPIAEATLPKLLSPRTLAENPDGVARVRDMILKSEPKGAAAAQRGMAARRDYSNDLSNIDVPTLIIVGRDDSIRPVADSEFMHRGIQNSCLEIIEDAAHMTNMEMPERFNQAVLDLVRQAASLS